ncbi:hypothetical protein RhiirC2_808981 [Rhizophagus irregularis]|uniref:Protein kinase domain-containing protein n=1 Tax=Rhizophagus irregularis TaxID=588596 RepID=A0A2N1MUV7_9GLOM|nr:hypothetical protein RhiirC2_808981 [Rhizophagus irregularis]
MHLFDPTLESQDFTINSAPYGNCPNCRRQRTSAAWCKNCNIANLKGKFNSWTSGNSMIDEFIQYTQLNANDKTYLEWIDFNQFNLVKNTNKRGAFSSIYSAIWMDGPSWILDEEAEVWTRNGPVNVILKRLDNSQSISQEFVNQFDIYSFGMIMWMLSAGVRPYCDRPYDSQLIQDICSGTRPNIVNGTPPVFARLMLQCLDANPSNRPAASQLYECLGNWIATICDDLDTSDLSNQFDVAEEIKFSNLKQLQFKILPCHEKAIYYSRLLNIGEPSLYGKM